jgi:hypothetical protein
LVRGHLKRFELREQAGTGGEGKSLQVRAIAQ